LGGHDFGELAANAPGDLPPVVVPTHFAIDGDTLLVHLARADPAWSAIEARPNVLVSVVDDYAFVPSTWRADAGGPDEDDVPTSYYTAVQLVCRAEVVDEPLDVAESLRRQLARFQPAGDHPALAVDQAPYGPMVTAIRGLRLHVESVSAKFKYDDQNPEAHRYAVSDRLVLVGAPATSVRLASSGGAFNASETGEHGPVNDPQAECARSGR
jgi:transcriptional regulator